MRRQIKHLVGFWKCKNYLVLYTDYTNSSVYYLLLCYDMIPAFRFCFSLTFRYAYAVASALHGVQHILRKDFMVQVLHLLKFLWPQCYSFRTMCLSDMMKNNKCSHHLIRSLGAHLSSISLMDVIIHSRYYNPKLQDFFYISLFYTKLFCSECIW